MTITSVKVGDTTLADDEGTYTLSNITSDTIVTVATDGTPPDEEDETYSVTFETTPQNATVVITDGTGAAVAPVDSVYELLAGTYTCEVSADGYNTKTGTFTVSGDAAFTITLTQGAARTVTIDSSVETFIVSDGLIVDTVPAGQTATALQLHDGTYTYTSGEWGGGSFTVSGDSALSLRKVDFSEQLSNGANVLYTMSVTDENSVVYTPAGTQADDGDLRAHFLVPALDNNMAYSYSFNVPDSYWGSYGIMYIYGDRDFLGMICRTAVSL